MRLRRKLTNKRLREVIFSKGEDEMIGKSTKVITGLVRFAYANVHKPVAVYNGEERYSVTLLISKEDEGTIDSVISAVDAAMEKGKEKIEKSRFEDMKMPVRDGDVERPEDKAYAGCYFINTYSKTQPQIVDKDLKLVLNEEEFYSGCYGRASITFYTFNHEGSAGVACGLGNLQKLKDGEVLIGYSDPRVEFGTFIEDYLE